MRPKAGTGDAPALQILRDHDEIVKRPRQPVELPDHQNVTGSAALQGFSQPFPFAQDARSVVLVDDLAARRPQRVELQARFWSSVETRA